MNRLVLQLLANAAYGFQAKSSCRNMNDLLRFTCTASLRHMNTNRVTSNKLKEYQSLLKKVTIIHKQVKIYSSARKYEWKDRMLNGSESKLSCFVEIVAGVGDLDALYDSRR